MVRFFLSSSSLLLVPSVTATEIGWLLWQHGVLLISPRCALLHYLKCEQRLSGFIIIFFLLSEPPTSGRVVAQIKPSEIKQKKNVGKSEDQ